MSDHRTTIVIQDLLNAFRSNNARVAWDIVVHNIAGKAGAGIEDAVLKADVVPRRWSWKDPSLAQAFALTFDGDSWRSSDGQDSYSFLEIVERPRSTDVVKSLSLSEMRASLYALQRVCRGSDSEPDPKLVRRLLAEIRKRLK